MLFEGFAYCQRALDPARAPFLAPNSEASRHNRRRPTADNRWQSAHHLLHSTSSQATQFYVAHANYHNARGKRVSFKEVV